MDVRNPIEKLRDKEIRGREELAGVLGFGPRPDIAARLSLGAAVTALVIAQRELGVEMDPARVVELGQRHWPQVLNHAVALYGEQLETGLKLQRNAQKIIAEQLAN